MGRTHRTNITTTRPEIPKSSVYKKVVRANRLAEDHEVKPYDADEELNQKFIDAGLVSEDDDEA